VDYQSDINKAICLIFKTLSKFHALNASYPSFYPFHINRDSHMNQYPSIKQVQKKQIKKILDIPHRGFNGITKSDSDLFTHDYLFLS